MQMPLNIPSREVEDMPESSFVANSRDSIPQPDRRTTSEAAWRQTATGQAAAVAAEHRGRGRGRGRARGRGGRGAGRARGRGRGGRGAPYWLWGDGEQEPEEYQNNEMNSSQNAPDDISDEN